MTELGEQSVAGLPAISGVIVLEVPPGSAAAKMGLQNLDVIWTAGGKPAPDYATLMQRLNAAPGPAAIQVYRSQKLITLPIR